MNGGDHAVASQVDRLQRRVNALSVLVGATIVATIVLGLLAARQASDAREARRQDASSKRKMQYLELKLGTHTDQADRQLMSLRQETERIQLYMRRGEQGTVRRWLNRSDRVMSADRARIEALENRLTTLQDSLGIH